MGKLLGKVCYRVNVLLYSYTVFLLLFYYWLIAMPYSCYYYFTEGGISFHHPLSLY